MLKDLKVHTTALCVNFQDFNFYNKFQIVFSGLCGSAHSFDLEVREQHSLEFSDWESQDYSIYH